jgi:hypothetical protein
VTGAAGGIGQPLALLMKMNPLVGELSLYDVVGTPGVGADLGHIDTAPKACWGCQPHLPFWPYTQLFHPTPRVYHLAADPLSCGLVDMADCTKSPLWPAYTALSSSSSHGLGCCM